MYVMFGPRGGLDAVVCCGGISGWLQNRVKLWVSRPERWYAFGL